MRRSERTGAGLALGLRENGPQFSLLVLVNGFVGAMVGAERSVLPLRAEAGFGLASATAGAPARTAAVRYSAAVRAPPSAPAASATQTVLMLTNSRMPCTPSSRP